MLPRRGHLRGSRRLLLLLFPEAKPTLSFRQSPLKAMSVISFRRLNCSQSPSVAYQASATLSGQIYAHGGVKSLKVLPSSTFSNWAVIEIGSPSGRLDADVGSVDADAVDWELAAAQLRWTRPQPPRRLSLRESVPLVILLLR